MSPAYPAFPAANRASGGGALASVHAVDGKITLETPGRGVSFHETLIREL
jgi:hypothetical protein